MVLIDSATLTTLPEREYLSGLAEVIKYGVVCDSTFFDFLAENREKILNRDSDCLLTVIRSSCALKASVVECDEKEGGCRAVLNYGHTFAHAIESLAGYSAYLHGEAVAMGMVQSACYPRKKDMPALRTQRGLLIWSVLFGSLSKLASFPNEAYLRVMLRDKKVRDGGINFVFNKKIGGAVIEKVADWDFLLHNVSR